MAISKKHTSGVYNQGGGITLMTDLQMAMNFDAADRAGKYSARGAFGCRTCTSVDWNRAYGPFTGTGPTNLGESIITLEGYVNYNKTALVFSTGYPGTSQGFEVNPSTDIYTFNFWVKSSDPHGGGAGADTAIATFYGNSSNYWFLSTTAGSSDAIGIYSTLTGGTAAGNDATTLTAWDGSWHMITVIGNGDSTADIYVDAGTPQTVNFDTGSYANPFTLYLGWNSAIAGYEGFQGEFDQPAVWYRKLGTSELSTLYNSGAGYATSNWGTFTNPCATVSISESNCTGFGDTTSTLTANITGTCTSPSYQWQQYTGEIYANISGATSSTYSLTILSNYRVIVTCNEHQIVSDLFTSTCGEKAAGNVSFTWANSGAACADDRVGGMNITNPTRWIDMASATGPQVGEFVYTDSSFTTPFDGDGKHWKFWVPCTRSFWALDIANTTGEITEATECYEIGPGDY